jgi:hypothetical protein
VESIAPVKLFWSGGWDSTFRLLQLVLSEKKLVQPYYLIDPKRKSLRNELKARREIINHLVREHPETRSLILPTIYYEVGDIVHDDELEQGYKEHRKTKRCESQYLWQAEYCKQFNIQDLEMAAERDEHDVPEVEKRYFGHFAEGTGKSGEYRIAKIHVNEPIYKIFGWYTFPIYDLSRQDMELEAARHGWSEYMQMTWFCHSPLRGRYPCGTCLPCQQAIKKGQGRRIPWWRRLYAQSGLEKVRQLGSGIIRKINPGFHTWRR